MVFKNHILPVVVLLVICIICVGVLAVLNDALYVSDKVKFDRAMAKIYPGVEFGAQEKVTYENANYGKVNSVTWAKDKAKGERIAVIETTSTNVGFGSGNVTLYVVVKEVAKSGKTVGEIAAWSIKDNVQQSYIGKIDGANKWYVGSDIANEIKMGSNMTSGATMTSTAINMAINMAADYARSVAEMGSNPQKEALDALVAQLTGDYATASYEALSTANATHLAPAGTTLSYMFTATVGTQEVYALVYDINGTQEFVVFANALSNADKQVVFKTAGITTEIETVVLSTYLSSTANIISVSVEGATATYTVVGLKRTYLPNNYTLEVVVKNGVVDAITVKKTGFVAHGPEESTTLFMTEELLNKTLESEEMQDGYIKFKADPSQPYTGATQSADIIWSAVKLALTHYQANYGGANV